MYVYPPESFCQFIFVARFPHFFNMDANPTPFPDKKSQCVKLKHNRKVNEPTSKASAKDPSIQRQKRVFGAARNPNIPTNPTIQKPVIKPQLKFTKITKPLIAKTPLVIEPSAKTIPEEKYRSKPKKKSVCFIEKAEEIVVKGSLVEPKTPLKSPYLAYKPPRLSGTPYHTAQRCSNCRFDRLETSAYWLNQIKQAETLEKHFVSAAFFQLAYECKAEPICNLREELKKYLARHEYLSADTKWINVCCVYSLVKKDKANGNEVGVGSGEASAGDGQNQDQEINEEAVLEEAERTGIQIV